MTVLHRASSALHQVSTGWVALVATATVVVFGGALVVLVIAFAAALVRGITG
jgi:hypothetical protein